MRASIYADIPRVDYFFPALRFAGKEFNELRSVSADHIKAHVVELLFYIRRINGGSEFGFEFGAYIGC